MADDDNFDIDIYGDDNYQDSSAQQQDTQQTDANAMNTDSHAAESTAPGSEVKPEGADQAMKQDNSGDVANGDTYHENGTQQISSTGGSAGSLNVHKQAPRQQGTKRKQGEDDDRPLDPGATAALMINDLNWWISEEDLRGWANQSGCEDELNEVTFNEHKVNGKSKGQVYVQLQSPQAATALKHQIDNLFKDQAHTKKPTAVFNPPHINPFKTLPKDVPQREKNRNDRSSSSNFGNQGGGSNFNRFNNNRGNFNRGGNNMGFQNRNFSGPSGGNMNNNMGGGYGGGPAMNNFGGGPMGGGMNNFGGGNFNRGGMMGGGMRGGMGNRGRGGGSMGMNNMGGMNMPMGGNMMGMGGGMMGMGNNMGMMGGMGGGPGFGNNQPHFNPAFFNQNQGGGNDGNWNPHGAKRPRPE